MKFKLCENRYESTYDIYEDNGVYYVYLDGSSVGQFSSLDDIQDAGYSIDLSEERKKKDPTKGA